MKRSEWMRDFIIGLVFLGALVAFGITTLKVVSLDVLGQSRAVTVPFDTINGLRTGNEVRLRGQTIGLVSRLEPEFAGAQPRILVHCRIQFPVDIPADSIFEVQSSSTLGGRHVEILPGTQPPIAIETGAFEGRASQDLFASLGELVDEVKESRGLLHQIIRNQEVGDDFAAVMKNVRTVTESLNSSERGILGALINDVELRERVEQVVADARDTLQAIRSGEGTVAMLINDPATRDDVRSFIDNAEQISRDIRESKGTVGKLINESTLHDDLAETVASAKAFMKDIQEGDGTLAMLARDTEFKNALKEGVIAFKDTVSGIRDGEGTIGQLARNRELYDKFVALVDNAADAVEDFREQAPVSTFVNVLFAGF